MVYLSKLAAAGLLAFSLSSCGQMAFAGTVCGPRAAVVEQLQKRFGEGIRGLGITRDSMGLIELWVAPDRTFTITTTDRGLTMCALLSGTNWQGGGEDAPVEPEQGSEDEHTKTGGHNGN